MASKNPNCFIMGCICANCRTYCPQCIHRSNKPRMFCIRPDTGEVTTDCEHHELVRFEEFNGAEEWKNHPYIPKGVYYKNQQSSL